MAVCPSCGVSILWVSTRTGRRLPLDAEPALVLHGWVLDGDGARLADPTRDHSAVPRYRNHWAICTHTPPHTAPAAGSGAASARVLPARGPDRRLPDRGRR